MPTMNKAQLIKRIEEQLEWEKAQAEERYQQALQTYEEQLQVWLVEGGKRDRLVTLLRQLIRKARGGTPVQMPNDLNTGYRNSTLWANFTKPDKSEYNNARLEGFKALLESVEEDTVSTSFLIDMGYRDFNSLFRR